MTLRLSPLPGAVRTGSGPQRPVRPVVIVIVLPLFQRLVEQVNVVRNAVLVEELVKLPVIDAVGALDLAVQVWCARPDVDVADVERFEMPTKVRLELGTIVGLNDMDTEG